MATALLRGWSIRFQSKDPVIKFPQPHSLQLLLMVRLAESTLVSKECCSTGPDLLQRYASQWSRPEAQNGPRGLLLEIPAGLASSNSSSDPTSLSF